MITNLQYEKLLKVFYNFSRDRNPTRIMYSKKFRAEHKLINPITINGVNYRFIRPSKIILNF